MGGKKGTDEPCLCLAFFFAVVFVLFWGVVCLVFVLCLVSGLVFFVADERMTRAREESHPRQSEAVSVAAHITLPHGFAKISLRQKKKCQKENTDSSQK
jgi:hypothetical protein